jgi:protein gp37
MSSTIYKSGVPWCDYKWKPHDGCERGCDYCYAERDFKRYRHLKPEMGNDFSNVTFFEREFNRPFPKKPARIFITESTDPEYWGFEESNRIWDRIADNQQHTFVLLTKCVKVYDYWRHVFKKLKNLWCGLTVNYSEQMGKHDIFRLIPNNIKFLSLEPIREEIPIKLFNPKLIDWLIIGGQSGPGEKFYPRIKWVKSVIDFCNNNGIPLFLKDNLAVINEDNVLQKLKDMSNDLKIQEWPEVKR